MVQSWKRTVFTLWAAALPVVVRGEVAETLEKRNLNATTNVVCQNSYSWMNNQNSQSPCLVASILSGACATAQGWNVPALGPEDAYSVPNSTTANYCVCSWAVYNLLGACTVCQGSPHVDNWSPYKVGCGSYTTNTYFPTNLITVPNNTLLPYWAATDPSTWSGGSFDSNSAATIYSQGKSDINLSATTQSSSTTSNSSNTGPIVGGVIGGLAAVATVVALFFYFRRRQRNKARRIALLDPLPNTTPNTLHGRSLSDTSQMTIKADPVMYSDFRPTVSPPSVYTSNSTINRTHVASPSINSLPYDVSIINGPASSPPPPPLSQQAMLGPQASMNGGPALENMIVPYTVTSSSQDLSSDRKRADGNLFPIFEQQNEFQVGPSNNQATTSRPRMNPPTYTESVMSDSSAIRSGAPSGSVDLKGRRHGHQGSSDTTDTESSWPRRQMVRDSALSGFTGITGIGSDVAPPSVVGVGSAVMTSSPADSQTRINVVGSVVGGDDIA